MIFRSEFTPKPFAVKIKHTDNLMLVGSCFTEQIGNKLAAHKFNVLENPNGILFNPISIAKSISSYTGGKLYNEEELFYYNELWASRQHHTKFSNPNKIVVLNKINESQQTAIEFIKEADWILLTLGSAFLYEWKNIDAENYNNVAANCHKIPTDKFNKRLATAEELKQVLLMMQNEVLAINPNAKFIYTISPVRHLREGFVENNRSKATLIQAVHELTNELNCFYFPAYELIIDDLRDYRFFAEDLVHPNYAATNYVWEKFCAALIDEPSKLLMKEINELNAAMSHKPFNKSSAAHKNFLQINLEKTKSLANKFVYINFKEMLEYFSA